MEGSEEFVKLTIGRAMGLVFFALVLYFGGVHRSEWTKRAYAV
jgi:hypothetical protein